ncbi:MAG: CPBP family intramembrane glutamic endopeptidase [Rhizomicrobium sp.]
MTDAATTADPPLRLKLVPILVAAVLGFGIPIAAAICTAIAIKLGHLAIAPGSNVAWLTAQHTFQLLLALVAIFILKRWLVPADYGLHWPRGKSYILPAIVWGTVLAMLVAAGSAWLHTMMHIPQTADSITYTGANVWGWSLFEWLYVGPTEEIPFRALLVTYLAATMPGRLRIGRFAMNWAGIIVALLFALAHIQSFWTVNWADALVQQVYAFVLGVAYAYWLEKSKSVVAPIVAHNLTDGLTIVFWALGVFQA